MGRVVAAEYVSVDGRMEMEDPEGKETETGGWTGPYWNDELAKMQYDLLFASDALLLGRITYESFAAAWPSRTEESLLPEDREFADRMNGMPKYVASATLSEPLEWNASLLEGDPAEEVRKLKDEPGNLLVYGSGQLLALLLDRDLVDELRLMIHPVVLGSGKRLLERVDGSRWNVADTRVTEKGVVTVMYQPAAS